MRTHQPFPSSRSHQYPVVIQPQQFLTTPSLHFSSKNFVSKLDLIKQQLSRQYQQKFNTQRKKIINHHPKKQKINRNKSQKLITQHNNHKIVFNHQSNSQDFHKCKNNSNYPTEQLFENFTYRQKFYDTQDKLFLQKQKSILNFQKNTILKQHIIQFLSSPNMQTANQLKNYFNTDKQCKIIDKFISLHSDKQLAEKTIKQILSIVQVPNIQSLLKQLTARQSGQKSLRDCSFKILELQTSYNKLELQSQSKLQSLTIQHTKKQKQLQSALQQLTHQFQYQIQHAIKQQQLYCKKLLTHLIDDINHSQLANCSEDIQSYLENSNQNVISTPPRKSHPQYSIITKQHLQIPQQSSLQQLVQQLRSIFKKLQQTLTKIQQQTQQNLQKFENSKQDLNHLQQLIEQIKHQTIQQKQYLISIYSSKLLQQSNLSINNQKIYKQTILRKQQQLYEISIKIQQHLKNIQIFRNLSKKCEQQKKQLLCSVQQKQQNFQKIIQIICQIVGQDPSTFKLHLNCKDDTKTNLSKSVGEITINKIELAIKKYILTLNNNLQRAQNQLLSHSQQLQTKARFIKQLQFDFNNLIQQFQNRDKQQKQLTFERDQYKYLLNTLRQSMRQTKKQHQQKILSIIQQKDDEYLNANKHILQQNQKLNDQIQQLQQKIQSIHHQAKSQATSHTFYRKKAEQFEISLMELRKKLVASQTQAAKYKHCLTDIQTSFKQVQNMLQATSQKMLTLQSQNHQISNSLTTLHQKNAQLTSQLRIKSQTLTKVQLQLQKTHNLSNKLSTSKQQLQLQNSNIKIKNISLIQQIKLHTQSTNKLQYQNFNLIKQNKKLIQQINQSTQKLIKYIQSNQINRSTNQHIKDIFNKTIKKSMNKLKQLFISTKNTIHDQLTIAKSQLVQQIQQIQNHLNQHLQQHPSQQQQNSPNKNKSNIMLNRLKQILVALTSIKQEKQSILSTIATQSNLIFNQLQQHLPQLGSAFHNNQSISIDYFKCHMNKFKNTLNQIKNDRNQIIKTMHQYQSNFNTLISNYQQSFNQLSHQQLYKYINSQLNQDHFNNNIISNNIENHSIITQQFINKHLPPHSSSNDNHLINCQQNNQPHQNQINVNGKQYQINQNHHAPSLFHVQDANSQVQRVKKILNSLINPSSQPSDPLIPYFDSIKPEYKQLKTKLKAKNLQLDISAVSFQPQIIQSPLSLSVVKDFIINQRCSTSPNDDFEFAMNHKQQCKCPKTKSEQQLITKILKQNTIYKSQLKQLQQLLKNKQIHEQQLKIKITQLQKKNIQLQNQSSIQIKNKLFIKFLTQIFNYNWKQSKITCRTLLKLTSLSNQQLTQILQQFDTFATNLPPSTTRHKKKWSGTLGNIFSHNKN